MKNNDRPRILWFAYFGLLLAANGWVKHYVHADTQVLETVIRILQLHFGVHLFLSECFLVAQYRAIKQGRTPWTFSWEPLNTWYSVGFVPQSDAGCRWIVFCAAMWLVGSIANVIVFFLK